VAARDGAVLVDGSHGVPVGSDEFLELGGGEQQPEPVAILDDALLAFQGAERGLVEPAPLAVNRLAERGLGHSVRLGGENGQDPVYAFSMVGQLTPSKSQSASWRLLVVRQPGHG